MPEYGSNIQLNEPAFIDDTAKLYGKLTVNKGASFWPYTVVRAEMQEVVIGEYTNIQDFVMIHVGDTTGTHVGSHCSITHHCTLHGCTIGDNCLIGINTTIMDGCVIGNNCIVAGHSFLKEGTIIPDNSIVMGTPGKVVRTQNNYARCRMNAFMYFRNALAYDKQQYREWADKECLDAMRSEMEILQKEQAEIEANSPPINV